MTDTDLPPRHKKGSPSEIVLPGSSVPDVTVPDTTLIPTAPAVVVPVTPSGAAAGPMMTGTVPGLPTTPITPKQTYSSVMSYVGITRRTTAWVRRVGAKGAALAVPAAVLWLLLMYSIVTVWYVVTLLLFSWLLFPFRLIRRSQRKNEALQRQQLATMQAMLIQQQNNQRG